MLSRRWVWGNDCNLLLVQVPAICLAIVQNYTLGRPAAPVRGWVLTKRGVRLDDDPSGGKDDRSFFLASYNSYLYIHTRTHGLTRTHARTHGRTHTHARTHTDRQT